MRNLLCALSFSIKYLFKSGGNLRLSRPLPLRRNFATSRASQQLKVMKINSPEYEGLFTEELQKLIGIFQKHGYELRLAGGAVRDLLMGVAPHDLDFATNATPTQMRNMFTEENVRMINTNGESHGTMTVRINDKVNYEVTTLRIDVVTDGRHAQVEFTKDWRLDANRRDLTINALFIDMHDATVHDYFSGVEDIEARRVRFVGNATARICEDYLRILRYFRFFGRVALRGDEEAHDAEALSAIKQHAAGLRRIAGERLWVELKQIVLQRFAPSVLRTMHSLGTFPYIGLPASPNLDEFERVFQRSVAPCLAQSHDSASCADSQLQLPMSSTMLAALLRNEDEVSTLNSRLKLSNDESGTARFILRQRDNVAQLVANGASRDQLVYFYQKLIVNRGESEGQQRGRKPTPPRKEGRATELCKYFGDEQVYCAVRDWRAPRFPLRGETLVTRGVRQSREFGHVVQRLRERWIASHFELDEAALLEALPAVLSEVEADFLKRDAENRAEAKATASNPKQDSPKRSKT